MSKLCPDCVRNVLLRKQLAGWVRYFIVGKATMQHIHEKKHSVHSYTHIYIYINIYIYICGRNLQVGDSNYCYLLPQIDNLVEEHGNHLSPSFTQL